MKIAFLFGGTGRGGAERVIASLANRFVSEGDQVDIVSADTKDPGYELDARVQVIHNDVAGVSRNALQALRRNWRSVMAIRRYTDTHRPQVITTFTTRLGVMAILAHPVHRKYRVVVSERANPKYSTEKGLVERIMLRLFLHRADRFIFQTERVMQAFPEKIRRKGVVIHNGVFNAAIPEVPTAFADRRHKDIVAVGRLARQKGYDILINAFAEFSAGHEGYRLHIYGEGAQLAALREQAAQLGAGEAVIFHGNVPDVTARIGDAGMFVMASRFEGMPNALIEAMACGLPCVSADCDYGPAELIQNGENGLLVPPEDAHALCTAMTRIADDGKLAEKLSAGALKIRETHSGEKIMRMYREAICTGGAQQP